MRENRGSGSVAGLRVTLARLKVQSPDKRASPITNWPAARVSGGWPAGGGKRFILMIGTFT